ncbi:hypothetical protein OY671_013031 [Metschnikowia pulcherrima]|nr:hypothetical protein OY671_013031 [Metschnikowia pulcherrima]
MYISAGMLVVGFVANLSVRQVAAKWFMKDAEVAALQAKSASASSSVQYGSRGIGKGGFDTTASSAWAVVGSPSAWGVWITSTKSSALFR